MMPMDREFYLLTRRPFPTLGLTFGVPIVEGANVFCVVQLHRDTVRNASGFVHVEKSLHKREPGNPTEMAFVRCEDRDRELQSRRRDEDIFVVDRDAL